MRKDESISIMSEGMERTKKSVEELIKDIDRAIEILIPSLKVKDKAKLGSYITIERTVIPERVHRNPKTNEDILKPSHEEIKISRTQALKDLVNK